MAPLQNTILLDQTPGVPGVPVGLSARTLRVAWALLTLATYGAWLVCLSGLIHELAHDLRWQVGQPSFVLQAIAYNVGLMLLLPVCILGYAALDHALSEIIAPMAHRAAPSFFARVFCYGAGIALIMMVLLVVCDGPAAVHSSDAFRGSQQPVILALLSLCLFMFLGIGAEWLEKRRPRLIWVKCVPPLLCGVVAVLLLVGDASLRSLGEYGINSLWDALWPPFTAAGRILTAWFLGGLACFIVSFVLEQRLAHRPERSARLLCALLWLAALGPVLTRVFMLHILGTRGGVSGTENAQNAGVIGLIAATVGFGLLRFGVFGWQWWRTGSTR